MEPTAGERFIVERSKGSGSDVEYHFGALDSACIQIFEERFTEVKPCSRSRDGAGYARVNCLVSIPVLRGLARIGSSDVWRKCGLTDFIGIRAGLETENNLSVFADFENLRGDGLAPATELHADPRPQSATQLQHRAKPGTALRVVVRTRERGEQQGFDRASTLAPPTQSRRLHAGGIHDQQVSRAKQIREFAELTVGACPV